VIRRPAFHSFVTDAARPASQQLNPGDPVERSIGMEKRIACNDVVPECTFTATAASEEELLKKVLAHASQDHGVTDVTPELVAKVKSAIKDHVHAK
jgi:predicted small metal-binding protein